MRSKESQKVTHLIRSPLNFLIDRFGSFTWGVNDEWGVTKVPAPVVEVVSPAAGEVTVIAGGMVVGTVVGTVAGDDNVEGGGGSMCGPGGSLSAEIESPLRAIVSPASTRLLVHSST